MIRAPRGEVLRALRKKRSRAWTLWAMWISVVALAHCGRSPRQAEETGSARSSWPSDPPSAPLPDSAFRVEWQRIDVPPTMSAGKTVTVQVAFKNASADTWPDPRHANPATGDGSYAVRLSYRWWKSGAAKPLAADEKRTDLTAPLLPRQSATLHVSVTAPTEPGDYLLQFDLVQELVTWFEWKGAPRKMVPVRVS